MSASQVYVASGASPAGSPNCLNIRGQNASLVLLSCAEGTSNVLGQPATQTLVFPVPYSVAADIPFFSKSVSATPASQIQACALANPGAANAAYTLTLSANEAFTASLAVYRLV